jgi:hypothetical protein
MDTANQLSAFGGKADIAQACQFVRLCEGFRMPADDGRGSELRGLGPAFENLQGRKSREGIRRRCGTLYGDLATAGGAADGSRRGRSGRPKRLIRGCGLFR